MRNTVYTVLLLVASVSLPLSAVGQEFVGAVSVTTQHQGNASTGRTLVYRLKEEIRESSAFKLKDDASFEIQVQTMPRSKDNPHLATLYAVQWVLYIGAGYPLLLDRTFGYAGTKVVSQTASSLMARTDEAISRVEDYYSNQ